MNQRRIILVFGAVLLTAAGSAPGQGFPPFQKRTPLPGESRSDTFVYFMAMDTEVSKDGRTVKGQPRSTYKTMKKEELILAADDTVTRTRATYSAVEEREEDDTSARVRRHPVSGSTYAVGWDGGQISVVKMGGAPLTDAEAAFVRRDMRGLGRANPYNVLSIMRLTPGQAVKELRDPLLNDLADAIRESPIEEFSVIFSGMEISRGMECGHFDLHLKLARTDAAGLKVTVDLKGRLLINTRTSQLSYLYLDGPVTLDGERDGAKIRGNGRASVMILSEWN